MTSRSTSRRPLSAIFLGSLPPKEINIPDISPPPESPTSVSGSSGLPSPPATNSTGSGSTGDNQSAHTGSIRLRPPPDSTLAMSPGDNANSFTVSKATKSASDDADDENDFANEEDNTARLNPGRIHRNTNEDLGTLQRVKSLAQRNRMAIDKLSSLSRLSTPSSSISGTGRISCSPLPPSDPQTSSSASFHPPLHLHTATRSRHNDALSGSETERESQRAPTPANSASHRPVSPERHSSSRLDNYRRATSPSLREARQMSPGPSCTMRKRVSIPTAVDDRPSKDITDTALAAVASSRKSPTGTGSMNGRSRQPLPQEFRHRQSLDGWNPVEPVTPYRTNSRGDRYATSENVPPGTAPHSTTNSRAALQISPRGRSNRSTVRDITRRHQTRWLSDDLSNTNVPNTGRRQTQRGGSAESTLGAAIEGAGRLAGESLRAAGIATRGGRQAATDDPFEDVRNHSVSLHRSKMDAASSTAGRMFEWEDGERERQLDNQRSRISGSSTHTSGPPSSSRSNMQSDPGRASTLLDQQNSWSNEKLLSSRPATSLGEFYHDNAGPSRSSVLPLRTRRSHDLPERVLPKESTLASSSFQQTSGELERSHSGRNVHQHTRKTPNHISKSSVGSTQNVEHTKLMMDSLSMFQSALSRLPNQSPTIRDLHYQAEAIIRSSERLNGLLRAGTTHAVQQQIAVEVDEEYDTQEGSKGTAQIWRDVGSDYREGLRESDEIVRTLTSFILGIGKVLKETAMMTASLPTENTKDNPQSASLDDEALYRHTPDGVAGRSNSSRHSQDGRRSVESRWSRDLMMTTGSSGPRQLSFQQDVNFGRPSSAREPDSASDRDRQVPSRNGVRLPPPLVPRRLLTPREMREQQLPSSGHNLTNVADSSMDYEPSPTPASRNVQNERSKAALPVATPPPLSALQSESLVRKTSLAEKQNWRKVSVASVSTVRATNSPFSLPVPNPTTAVTAHTVSGSPEKSTVPLERTSSLDSERSFVTFSRPAEVSLSTLQQQHSRDEARRRGGNDGPSVDRIQSSLSGSETERDTRRRTLGARVARMSLDAAIEERQSEASGAGVHLRTKTITLPSQRGRRRTVTEIFS